MSDWNEDIVKELHKRYELPPDKYQSSLQEIIRSYASRKKQSDKPTLIILGGQPGAGKTELQLVAEYNLLHNAVVCNADLFRDAHPMAVQIKKNYPELYPQITAEYARRWNDDLCEYCRANKLNYILETTFSSGERLNHTIKVAKESGYKVDIYLLAVYPELSRLGTSLRYEKLYAKSGLARRVLQVDHDIRFKAIPVTLGIIESAHLYDDIYIFSRSIAVKNTTKVEGVTIIAHNPESPLKIYERELKRFWPEKLRQYFFKHCEKVIDYMKKRNASKQEQDQFKLYVGLIKQQKREQKRKGLGF
jgi:predicted ABC-type ATPase